MLLLQFQRSGCGKLLSRVQLTYIRMRNVVFVGTGVACKAPGGAPTRKTFRQDSWRDWADVDAVVECGGWGAGAALAFLEGKAMTIRVFPGASYVMAPSLRHP